MADIQMSPRKALRAAMLKSRFADTIFRATHPTLQEHVMMLSTLSLKLCYSIGLHRNNHILLLKMNFGILLQGKTCNLSSMQQEKLRLEKEQLEGDYILHHLYIQVSMHV